ncbi:Zn-dependent hydrolase [Cutibacterium acnes JCM 18920]|nr:Zn-dependent hydrolase [Cutibacterium acnes JCM 18920]
MAETGLMRPPDLQPDVLRIIPLGGLGDVGRNMSCYEINGEMLVIDCGVLFPEDDHPGVDLLLPGLDYLDEEKLARVKALVLTHGHEDHIGAVPYLLKRRSDIPIYGSKLTLALVEAKLREHRIKGYKLNVVHEGDVAEVGEQFDLEFIAVNHSIPDALAVCVRTDAGTLINTGDFKMDQLPLDGRITDLRAFARLGEEGVDLFMVDSTNAEVPGFVKSETEIELLSRESSRRRKRSLLWLASPPMCIASSKCSIWPCVITARSATSVVQWSAIWLLLRTWATLTFRGTLSSSCATSTTTGITRSSSSPLGPRESHFRP